MEVKGEESRGTQGKGSERVTQDVERISKGIEGLEIEERGNPFCKTQF